MLNTPFANISGKALWEIKRNIDTCDEYQFQQISLCLVRNYISEFRLPWIGWRKQQKLIAHNLRPKAKFECQLHQILVPSLSSVAKCRNFLLYTEVVEGVRGHCGVSFIKTLFKFRRLYPHDLSTFQRPHLSISSHCMVGFQRMNFRTTQIFRQYPYSSKLLFLFIGHQFKSQSSKSYLNII